MIWSTDTLTGWMGEFTYPGRPIVSQYDYVAYTAPGDECQFAGSVACGVEAPKRSYLDDLDGWQVSHGWHNGAVQNCTWDRSRAAVTNGVLNLSFAKKTLADREYVCAEVQGKEERGYGTYEVRMKGVAHSVKFGFVNYGLKWTAERMDFYVDGTLSYSITDPAKIPGRATHPFLTIWASDINPNMARSPTPAGR